MKLNILWKKYHGEVVDSTVYGASIASLLFLRAVLVSDSDGLLYIVAGASAPPS
jgi:hypothetical protein